MVNPLYVLVGGFALVVSAFTLVRTRAVLRFRSPGRIEPGSIPDWKVWAWRFMAAWMMVLTVAFLAVASGV